MPTDGLISIHVPKPVGLFRIFKNRWDPLDVLIDKALVGRIAGGQTWDFPVTTGRHEVQVRWARAHHVRSNVVNVEAVDFVKLTLPLWMLAVSGIPRLRLDSLQTGGDD